MSPLHMMSLPVNLRELRRLGAVHGLGLDEGRALHHLLAETFGKGAIQPFRLMPGRNGAILASLYGYTQRDKASLQESARETAPPESALVFDLERLAVKTMPEEWSMGRRLAFDIRVRPVKRLVKPLEATTSATRRAALKGQEKGPIAKGAEVDAYLVARARANPDEKKDEARDEGNGPSREDVYRLWLAERLRGATLDVAATRLVSYERAGARRSPAGGAGRASDVTGPDVIFHGELTIADPRMFEETLRQGVGRHKAYGYGMLLLRPARS